MDYRNTAKEICKTFEGKEVRKIAKFFEEGFKGSYVMLRILRNSETDVLPGDIAKIMDISTARVAAALKTLEKKGYITRAPSDSDCRKTVVKITPEGLRALGKREQASYDLMETFFKKLTESEVENFLAIIKKLFR